MARRDDFAVGLDVGSRWARSVVAEKDEKGFHIIGIGKAECPGVNCGTVMNIESTTQSIDRAVDDAARMAGYPIGKVVLDSTAVVLPHKAQVGPTGLNAVIAGSGRGRGVVLGHRALKPGSWEWYGGGRLNERPGPELVTAASFRT